MGTLAPPAAAAFFFSTKPRSCWMGKRQKKEKKMLGVNTEAGLSFAYLFGDVAFLTERVQRVEVEIAQPGLLFKVQKRENLLMKEANMEKREEKKLRRA